MNIVWVQARSLATGATCAAEGVPGSCGAARRAIQNRFITKLISVRHSGFALGRGSLICELSQ